MRLLASFICLLLLTFTAFSQKLLIDTSFAPTLNGRVNFMEVVSGGKLLIAGEFTVVDGVTVNKIARLNADGSFDSSFNANAAISAGNFIYSLEILSDGKILLGGDFGAAEPSGHRKVVLRLNADGASDSTLTDVPRVLGGTHLGYPVKLRKAEQLPNGKIMICGNFQTANGNPRQWIARYNSDGSYDSSFTNTINNYCNDVESQPDGKYLVAGSYTTVNGNSNVGLTRFNTEDTIDTTFNADHTSGVTYYRGIEVLGDGAILSSQQSNNNSFVSRAAQLNSAGGRLKLYDENATNVSDDYIRDISDVAFQADGKSYILDGSREVLHRYNTDGTRDASLDWMFFNSSEFFHGLKAVAVLPDGKIIVGGDFNEIFIAPNSQTPTATQKFLARFTPQTIAVRPKYDFDGDGKDDIGLYRPDSAVWYLNLSTSGFFATQFGLSTDIPVTQDYDGDGRADIGVFRNGVWYWLKSSDLTFGASVMGQAGDIPLSGKYYINRTYNYGGLVVFRPAIGRFYVEQPFANPIEFTINGLQMLSTDKPIVADFDGDGENDIGVYRDGNWYTGMSGNYNLLKHFQFGIAGDKAVIGDFDGDLRTDYAVFRPSNGSWYIQKSADGFYAVQWGLADDLPVPADYDGDGKVDIAVYRPSTGVWYILKSTGSYHIEQFGLSGDIPAQLR